MRKMTTTTGTSDGTDFSRSEMERIFVARGILALVFAAVIFLALAFAPGYAVRVFAGFAILDGLLAITAGYRAHADWKNPSKTALLAEGIIGCAAGVVIAINQDVPVIAFAIAANAIIGGALASMHSMAQRSEYRADWWAVYGILGVLLGFAIEPLMAVGTSAMLIAVGSVVAVQGVARIFLRGGSGPRIGEANT
jgi:uncharacterized membrane protein HdeD (DUF308 family)